MTNIQWTDKTANPIKVKGGGYWCHKYSEGCANCYSEKINGNPFFNGNGLKYGGIAPEMELDRELLASWSRMRKPYKHFVASMTDVFGEWVKPEWQQEILTAMWQAPNQTFQLLTKRPHIMLVAVDEWLRYNNRQWLPNNIWCGTSIENQRKANERIPQLLKVRSLTRFLSIEPLLEPIDIKQAMEIGLQNRIITPGLPGVGVQRTHGISWVIVGGESGNAARECHVSWIRSIIQQCQQASAPVFVKQLGSNPVFSESDHPSHFPYFSISNKGGEPDEWPEDLRVREFPEAIASTNG